MTTCVVQPGEIRMHPVRRCSGASKKPPVRGRPACMSSSSSPYPACCPRPHKWPPIIGSSISTRLRRANVWFGVTRFVPFFTEPCRVRLWYGHPLVLSTFVSVSRGTPITVNRDLSALSHPARRNITVIHGEAINMMLRGNGRRVRDFLKASDRVHHRNGACIASRAISLMRISPVTISGRFEVNTLITSGPRSSITKPTSFATVS